MKGGVGRRVPDKVGYTKFASIWGCRSVPSVQTRQGRLHHHHHHFPRPWRVGIATNIRKPGAWSGQSGTRSSQKLTFSQEPAAARLPPRATRNPRCQAWSALSQGLDPRSQSAECGSRKHPGAGRRAVRSPRRWAFRHPSQRVAPAPGSSLTPLPARPQPRGYRGHLFSGAPQTMESSEVSWTWCWGGGAGTR